MESNLSSKKIFIIIIIILLVCFTALVFLLTKDNRVNQVETQQEVPEVVSQTPEVNEANGGISNVLPPDFPTDIPIEVGSQFTQNYSIPVEGQQQMTIAFLSSQSIKENYIRYATYLDMAGWNTTNRYESAEISSVYGVKDNFEINVTINLPEIATPGAISQVTISVLKK